ncbi:MAG: group II intron reverse transcriptase/maturase [Candidatus Omnitrophica bacterium]|nr:group II intron reverse transcriptase/maturase [Candidatus Omnitrophota bacterium]
MGEKDTSTGHRTGTKTVTKLSLITSRAKRNPKERFISLMHLLNEDFLEECFYCLKRNKAVGVDGVKVEEYGANLRENIEDLVKRMRSWSYRPKPVRRVYIPKGKGKMRPLGIVSVEDKVVEMALKRILEAIYEVDFLPVSYGFRPSRNCHQAVDTVYKAVMVRPTNHIADVDIERFFDTVDHKKLKALLEKRIGDPNIVRLISRFLKAGYLEEGKYYRVDEGTAQGSSLSPLLANVYLHYALDLWFEKCFKKEAIAYCQLVRYADDVVAAFQKKADATRFGKEVKERLAEFGLKISEEKSRIIPFGRYSSASAEREGKKSNTFDFLGFTFYCTKSRKGNFLLGRRTAKKKYRQKIKELKYWLKATRNLVKLEEWWKILARKLEGHYRYYGISGNMREMQSYHRQVMSMTFKWVNRRSQRKSYNWCQFCRYLQYNPLPKPKIYHAYPVLW